MPSESNQTSPRPVMVATALLPNMTAMASEIGTSTCSIPRRSDATARCRIGQAENATIGIASPSDSQRNMPSSFGSMPKASPPYRLTAKSMMFMAQAAATPSRRISIRAARSSRSTSAPGRSGRAP